MRIGDENHHEKVANSAFFPYFFGEIFEEKKKNPLSLSQFIFRFCNNAKFCTKKMFLYLKQIIIIIIKMSIYIYIYNTKNHYL